MCLVHKHCVSFNYDRTSGVCQLNDADADVYPCHLVDSDHFGYYQIDIGEYEQVSTCNVMLLCVWYIDTVCRSTMTRLLEFVN